MLKKKRTVWFAAVLSIVMLFSVLGTGTTVAAEEEEPVMLESDDAELDMPVGDAAVVPRQGGFVELSDEELEEAERSVRDYKGTGKSLLVNKAKHFYYYEQLTEDEQYIYDAMLQVVYDPVNSGFISGAMLYMDPNSPEFRSTANKVYYAMLYDHPELFWLYNTKDYYIYWSGRETAVPGLYSICFGLNKAYEEYEKEVKAFNKAVKKFLKKIDLKAGKKKIARQIHDELLKTVTYDYNVLDNMTEERYNRAHTAYGALVANSQGEKHTAVCDGYAQAYVYLMQQAGCEAVVIMGEAGSPGNTGGHAWNMASLKGKWYEIDVTWDDLDRADEITNKNDQPFYKYVKEAMKDDEYMKLRHHYMYCITTKQISDFHTSEKYRYYTKDGKYWISLIGDSVHIRDSELNRFAASKAIMELAPIAE